MSELSVFESIRQDYEEKIEGLQQEIEKTKIFYRNRSNDLQIYIKTLLQRIDKAIEYIENKTEKVKYKEIGITEKRLYLIHNQVDYLLDILKGSDKE